MKTQKTGLCPPIRKKVTVKEYYKKVVHWIKQCIWLMKLHRRKHLIIKTLTESFDDGERRSGNGLEVTDLGKSVTNIGIHLKTNLKIHQIDSICVMLIAQGYVVGFRNDDKNKAHRYLITDLGRVAAYENQFKDMIWYRNFDFLKWFIPTLISLTALIIVLVRN